MGFVEAAAVVVVSRLYHTKSTLLPHQNTQSYQCHIQISFFFLINFEFQDEENEMFHKEKEG